MPVAFRSREASHGSARLYLMDMAQKRRSRDWEANYAESKATIVAAAATICQKHQIPYDRLQFVCFGNDRTDYDGLVYVWVEKGARILSVVLAADDATSSTEDEPPVEPTAATE